MAGTPSDRRMISLGFTHHQVPEGQHICFIYNDDAQRRRVMAKFLESGLLEGERVRYLADEIVPDEMLHELEAMGVDLSNQRGELQISQATSAYLPDGKLDPTRAIEGLRAFYNGAVQEDGFTGTRIAGSTEWAWHEGHANIEALMEYEAQVNDVLTECPCTACCQYDSRRFDGSLIMDVLAVHPMMIVRGQLVQNPFYVDPMDFLTEYRGRK